MILAVAGRTLLVLSLIQVSHISLYGQPSSWVALAHRLVYSAYPPLAEGLATERVHLLVNASRDGLVRVAAYGVLPGAARDQLLMDGVIQFDSYGLVVSLEAQGRALEASRNAELTDLIQSNPDWGHARLGEWLGANGGVSADSLLHRINSSESTNWTSFLGTGVVVGVPVLWPKPSHTRSLSRVSSLAPVWVVAATATMPNHIRVKYELEFETISGGLVRVTRE